MTIGQKIILLRNSMGISQEKLAELLGVSRQSVSKWEMDVSLPQIDKILQLCELFKVSADELLHDNLIIDRQKRKNKYFGTFTFENILAFDTKEFIAPFVASW